MNSNHGTGKVNRIENNKIELELIMWLEAVMVAIMHDEEESAISHIRCKYVHAM